jgi:3-deoxy-manno-octulosonate cytidylyltransferase (CMP-KDO synthetase)
MKAVGIIPARYGSTRLPAKALALIAGKALIQHVYEGAKKAKSLDEVYVATDDERIMQAAAKSGAKAVMTSASCVSGADRVAEVARKLDAQVVLNIQGDEPLVRPEHLDKIANYLLAHKAVPMATVMTKIKCAEDILNPNVVKVVTDVYGFALYFSRSPIPYVRKQAKSTPSFSHVYWKHLGLYGYQRDFLLRFPQLEPTQLEKSEQLEQLRALENGYKIQVLETPYDTIGVDTKEDLERVEKILSGQKGPSRNRA